MKDEPSPDSGDEFRQRLDRVYRTSRKGLERMISARIRHKGDVQDVTHKTYLKVLEAGPDCATDLELTKFLFVTARNLIIDRARHDVVHSRTRHFLSEPGDADEVDYEFMTLLHQTRDELRQYLSELPESLQTAWRLSASGIALADIAMQLQVSRVTVAHYITRVVAHCKMRFEESSFSSFQSARTPTQGRPS